MDKIPGNIYYPHKLAKSEKLNNNAYSECESSCQISDSLTINPETKDPAIQFKPVPGVPNVAISSNNFTFIKTEPQEISKHMVAYMRKWPSVTSVIAIGSSNINESSILVESRPKAIEKSNLEGVYEVVQRLSSSSSIKDAARQYPSEFHTVRPLNSEGTLHEIHLPGKQTPETISIALNEGGKPNQLDQVKRLVTELPKDKRVALLIAGPSGAGKSHLIKQVREFAEYEGRKVVDLQGDMYFKDIDNPDYPKTPKNTLYWDSTEAIDMERFKNDIASLINDGSCETPVYNLNDIRPGGWRIPGVQFKGFREENSRKVELGSNDILVIDSLHAANKQIISYLDELGLTHATIYLDSESAEDRLVRRIIRDYAERGGILPKTSIELWNDTTWPGEKEYVRPTILQMDPARDTFLITKLPNDPGFTREELNKKASLLEEFGLSPTYETFLAKPEELAELAKKEEKLLEEIINSKSTTEPDRQKAQKRIQTIRSAPAYKPREK